MQGLEGKLTEILGIDTISESDKQGLRDHPEFISAYLEWEFQDTFYDYVRKGRLGYEVGTIFFNCFRPISQIKPPENVDGRDFGRIVIKDRKKDELREVYEFFVETTLAHPEGNKVMYKGLRDGYVNILKLWEQDAKTIGIFKRFVEPAFGPEGYIPKKDLMDILSRLPRREFRDIGGPILKKFTKQGITRRELQDLSNQVEEKDRYRKALHDQVKKYGQEIGLTEEDVLADIVFEFHNTNYNVKLEQEQIKVCAGMLLLNDYDPELGAKVREGSLRSGHFDDRAYEQNRKTALMILEKFQKGKSWGANKYASQSGTTTIEQDKEKLREIKEKHPEIPMTIGFEPSHACHGFAVYALNLTADLSGFYDKPDLENKMEALITTINEFIAADYL